MIRGAIENLLQINCQSEWGEGGVGIRIERIRSMLSRHNQTLTAPPPSPTQAMNNDSSPVYDDTSDYEAFITKRNCCKLKQIVKFEDQY